MTAHDGAGLTTGPVVHVRVQHHPSRAGAVLDRLLRSLLPVVPEIIRDDEMLPPSAWRTHRACLLTPLPDDATHLLVVQDDTYAADGFWHALHLILRRHPDRMVATFLAGAPVMRARQAQRLIRQQPCGYIEIDHDNRHGREFVPTVATVWPRADLTAFEEWLAAGNEPPANKRDDDPVVGTFCRKTGRAVVVPVPSLIQHPDDQPSTVGRPHRLGRNPFRVAAAFTGQVAHLDWTTA